MPPKGSGGLRRVPSSLSKVSTPPANTPTLPKKSSKGSRIVELKVPKDFLASLSDKTPGAKAGDAKSKASPKASTKPLPSAASSGPATIVKTDTDAPASIRGGEGDDSQSPAKSIPEGNKKDPQTGEKREAGADVEDDGKAKSKAPQRKRPKVGENGRLDGRTTAAKAAGFIASAHKLGPKANQGAINEKLRALDRTGKPCRKWQKTGFKIKSFTGRVWELPSWRAPEGRLFGSEAESQGTSNELSKENSSSNIGSEKSPAILPPEAASSPAPVVPITA